MRLRFCIEWVEYGNHCSRASIIWKFRPTFACALPAIATSATECEVRYQANTRNQTSNELHSRQFDIKILSFAAWNVTDASSSFIKFHYGVAALPPLKHLERERERDPGRICGTAHIVASTMCLSFAPPKNKPRRRLPSSAGFWLMCVCTRELRKDNCVRQRPHDTSTEQINNGVDLVRSPLIGMRTRMSWNDA